MRIQSLFSFIFVLCTIQFSKAQTPFLHNVVSPSPNASALAEYVITSPNIYTGVPAINIPITTITSKKLSWPITLSYHASGIKVGEVGGWVGLGWSLQGANAVVTRAMRGMPDEAAGGYFEHASTVPDETASIALSLKTDLAEGYADMIPDVFYYNTGASGGKIVFDNSLVPRKIPHNDAKISVNTGTLAEFTITEPDGTIYQFADAETSNTYVLGPDPPGFKSTWYLTRIISADHRDTIKFNYTTYSYQYVTNEQATLKYYYNVPFGASKVNNQIDYDESKSQTSISNAKLLSSIEFHGGKLEFQSSSRTDDDSKKLDAVIIYYKDPFTGAYIENKRINFYYSYFSSGSAARLRLDSLKEQASGQYMPAQKFEYVTNSLPSKESFSQDHWGYYNGEDNDGPLPARAYGGNTLSDGNREISITHVIGCMLKKIISPLEGETEFVFEPNQYRDGSVNKSGPGLRIQKIIKRDPYTSIEAVTNFNYTRPLDGLSSGKLLASPNYDTWMDVVDNNGGTTYYYNCWVLHASPVGVGNFSDNPVLYDYVVMYQGDNETISGKTLTKFSTYNPSYSQYPPYITRIDDSWLAGQLLEQEQFKVVGSTATPVVKVVNSYSIHSVMTQIKGLKVGYNKLLINTSPTNSDFNVENLHVFIKYQYLEQSVRSTFEENSSTVFSTRTQAHHYDAELDHTFPVKIVTQTSDTGLTLQEEISYPADYTTGVFGEMKALNMIALPVERKTFSIQGANEYLVNYSKSEFLDWGNQDIYPKYSYRPKVATPVLRSTFNSNPSAYLQKALTIVKYSDAGIPVESKPEDGQSNATLIDTYHQSAIATCSPATIDQIAYTGFETPYRGQWTVNQGSSQQTGNVTLSLTSPSSAFEIHANQTINYSYSVTRTAGPSPTLTFSKIGAGPITQTLSLTSGSGNASLTPGVWTATVDWESNVSVMSASFSYSYTLWSPLNISSTAKTGLQSLSLQTGNTISKTGLPAGDYVVSYYQKNGTVSFSVSGSASVLSTESNAAEADGWSLMRKVIRIVNTTDAMQLTCTSCLVDELRLQPIESFMTTQSYDRQGRLVTQTDQNIRSQYIEYDVWDRVIITRDNERNIQQHYEYKFANN